MKAAAQRLNNAPGGAALLCILLLFRGVLTEYAASCWSYEVKDAYYYAPMRQNTPNKLLDLLQLKVALGHA